MIFQISPKLSVARDLPQTPVPLPPPPATPMHGSGKYQLHSL